MKLTKQTPIAVLMGGPGSERPISLASGHAVADALRSLGYERITEVDVEGTDIQLPPGTELAYNVIHGSFGEDGQLQSALDALGVPYTGARAASSKLCFDKVAFKHRMIEAGVRTPSAETLILPAPPASPSSVRPKMSLPYVVKPPKEGSSVGIHLVFSDEDAITALEDAAHYDSTLLIEQYVKGKELTVGVFNDMALPIVHISPRSGFYDMNNKYPWLTKQGGTDYFCPADLDEQTTRAVQELALEAHKAAGVEVYSRVDVMLREDGVPFVIEINTIPGMTSSSLLPKAAAAIGIGFPELCERIAECSILLDS